MLLLRKNWPVLSLGLVLAIGLVLPLATKVSPPGFYVEVLLGGLMAGVLYSLVALGFALIFKASGVFNFAQGAMVLFAALAVARLGEKMPLWLAMLLAMAIMYVLAVVIERLVLRPLVNQEGVALLMATLGVTYFLDGFGQTIWGSDIYSIELGVAKEPVMITSVTASAAMNGIFSMSRTSESAAKSTIAPWAKLKTPEALKISTRPMATSE